MIRTKPPSDAYRAGWDRVFSDEHDKVPAAEPKTNAIEMRVRSYLWHCKTCQAYVSDPENHQYHVTIGPLTEPVA